jgi:hypothetical protein
MTPEGNYEGKILAHGLIKSSGKGTPGLEVRCEVATEGQGKKVVTTTLWLSPGAIKGSKSKIGGMGFQGRIRQLDPRAGDSFVDLSGTIVTLKCKHEDYEGKPQERWEIAGGGNEPLPLDDFDKVDAAFAGEFQAADEDVPY